ncbi:MAG: hypothetical protein ACTHXA_08610 [Gulosibacter sp.]|uniref:hypothetical protein n=1 Tax=Gulosibacter sp. TaxID=2817531 RepID=UPI003F93602C
MNDRRPHLDASHADIDLASQQREAERARVLRMNGFTEGDITPPPPEPSKATTTTSAPKAKAKPTPKPTAPKSNKQASTSKAKTRTREIDREKAWDFAKSVHARQQAIAAKKRAARNDAANTSHTHLPKSGSLGSIQF